MDFAWVVPLVSAGVGAYVGGYLKTKGENLATHEDIELLKEKVATITTTTEQIKAEISDAMWNRQKRWELKREVLLDAAKRLAAVGDSLARLNAMMDAQASGKLTDDDRGKALDMFEHAEKDLMETIYVAAAVCDKETSLALLRVGSAATIIATGTINFSSPSVYGAHKETLWNSVLAAQEAIRKELGIEEQE